MELSPHTKIFIDNGALNIVLSIPLLMQLSNPSSSRPAGRPSKLSTDEAALLVQLINAGGCVTAIADSFGVSRATAYRYYRLNGALQQ